ncbi:MAG: thiamine-phosphate kinase [Bythopirellula sp.]
MSLEGDLIDWLEKHLPGGSRIHVGLGDDGAVLQGFGNSQPVVTTDMLTDGVDFLLDAVEPQQVGHKALGVNLSDLAAMAAQPIAVFVSLVLPTAGSGRLSAFELATGIYLGMMPLAERLGVTIAGGDTNSWNGPLAISITAVGESTEQGPLTRSGGQVGDQLVVSGQLGGSILGRHLQVEPRVEEALLLHQRYELHAGIDISDGLALDTARLAKASSLGAVLDLSAVPLADAAHRQSKQDGRSAIEHALGDGEDFELVLAVPDQAARQLLQEQPLEVELTRIGQLIEHPGLWQKNEQGELNPLEPRGFQHGEDL